jgi:hypothetical protein
MLPAAIVGVTPSVQTACPGGAHGLLYSTRMDVMTLAYDDTLVRMDDAVIELFRRIVVGSQRIPLVWAGVQLKPKKGDQIHVNVGTLIEPTGPFYNDGIISNGAFNFDVSASEEPRLREFFDEAARRAGRPFQTTG